MSDTIANDIEVQVEVDYLEEESEPDQERYVFSYHITITNQGDETVQLMSRHWIITNANGKAEDVRGSGVVGQQPVLAPGESFSYTSFCPLDTPVGTMHGEYHFVNEEMEKLEAKIIPFTLSANVPIH